MKKKVAFEGAYEDIPQFWNAFCEKCIKGKNGKEVQEVIETCMVGEYGICIGDQKDKERFTYVIGGIYQGGAVPEGMKIFEIPEMEWAKFSCVGSLPVSLQTINTKI